MRKIELFGRVVDGELKINRKQFKNELQSFGNHSIRLVVEQLLNKRSNQQNRYLHLLFTIFQKALNELGNEFSMEEVKELCKCKFLKVDVINSETGEVIGERIKGTSELTKEEMSVFVESVIRWAADMFHITLPYPNEALEIPIAA